MAKCKCKNTVNNRKCKMASSAPSYSTTVRDEQFNTTDA